MAIVHEADAIKQLLSRGIASINQRGSVVVDPYATLQLLSQGIERLLKLTVMFQHHREHGAFPSVRGYSHKLDTVAAAVLEAAQGHRDSSHFRALDADMEFAATDPTLKILIKACATFSSGGRYHHLDVAAGEVRDPEQAPGVAWEAIETSARAGDPDLLQRIAALDYETHQDGLEELNRRVTSIVQRYIRFIARLWVSGPTGDIARQFSSTLQVWLMLTDEELGTPHGS